MSAGEAIDWGGLRSACARKAWREAWALVGVEHDGDPTPGELYIFGAARPVLSMAAALRGWYLESEMMPGVDKPTVWVARWQRIKGIARWESQTARAVEAQRAYKKAKLEGWLAQIVHHDLSAPAGPFFLSAFDMDLERAANIAAGALRLNDRPLERFELEPIRIEPGHQAWETSGDPLGDLLRARDAAERITGDFIVMGHNVARALIQFGDDARAATQAMTGMARALVEVGRDARLYVNEASKVAAVMPRPNPAPRGPQPKRRRSR